ncbi:MAG: homocitrate synthase [Candidatus Dormibacteraeota bacterium]|nr:homocitrate synthase [Candidatus Dormibacteraeota bacterium]MBV9526146.1 homocitrate synthase [Candidatus Dormibacteraeota bacterium]
MSIPHLRIIDSTLREGEQFAHAHFSTAQKLQIAAALDRFGVDYMELTSPLASPQSESDLRTVAQMARRFRLLTHVRCSLADARRAIDTGVDGVDVLFATSTRLRTASHGLSIDEIIEIGTAVVREIRAAGLEARFSSEDSFRSDPDSLVRVYRAMDAAGASRVGLADTVGVATPRQVHELVALVRSSVACDVEFHAHNDTGCAVANAHAALEAGATHVDTTILGIGERNGIVPLSSLIARLLTVQPDLVDRYRLEMLPELDHMLAGMLGVDVPFTAPVTAPTAFHHKAGLHTKAVIADPGAYEALDPARFGLQRRVLAGHRLAGRHAIRARATALGVQLDDAQLRRLTMEVKRRADGGPLPDHDLDGLIAAWPAAVEGTA